jgi:hypothetical protein
MVDDPPRIYRACFSHFDLDLSRIAIFCFFFFWFGGVYAPLENTQEQVRNRRTSSTSRTQKIICDQSIIRRSSLPERSNSVSCLLVSVFLRVRGEKVFSHFEKFYFFCVGKNLVKTTTKSKPINLWAEN